MDLTTLSPQTLTAMAGVFTTIAGSVGSWVIAKRKAKKIESDTATSAFKELAEANRLFRMEVKADLQHAQERIAILEVAIISKDKKIFELELQISKLRSELEQFQKENE